MNIEIQKGNLFDCQSDAIILTVEGIKKGMEGNIARAFGRLYPDVWEELENEIEYPIAIGTAKIYTIDTDLDCNNSYCIVASTLHHIGVLDKSEKLKVISSALMHSLSLAANKHITTVCTGILTGGWRLPIEDAFEEMLTTYQRIKSTSIHIPQLKICIVNSAEFSKIETYLHYNYNSTKSSPDTLRIDL